MVVVNEEPEAETSAVSAEVVMALDMVALPPAAPAAPVPLVTVAVTVAVEEAEPRGSYCQSDVVLPIEASGCRVRGGLTGHGAS